MNIEEILEKLRTAVECAEEAREAADAALCECRELLDELKKPNVAAAFSAQCVADERAQARLAAEVAANAFSAQCVADERAQARLAAEVAAKALQ